MGRQERMPSIWPKIWKNSRKIETDRLKKKKKQTGLHQQRNQSGGKCSTSYHRSIKCGSSQGSSEETQSLSQQRQSRRSWGAVVRVSHSTMTSETAVLVTLLLSDRSQQGWLLPMGQNQRKLQRKVGYTLSKGYHGRATDLKEKQIVGAWRAQSQQHVTLDRGQWVWVWRWV